MRLTNEKKLLVQAICAAAHSREASLPIAALRDYLEVDERALRRYVERLKRTNGLVFTRENIKPLLDFVQSAHSADGGVFETMCNKIIDEADHLLTYHPDQYNDQ